MRDFKRRKLIRSILYSPLAASLLLLVVFFVLHAVWNIFAMYQQTKQNYEIVREEYSELVDRKENIEERVGLLSTERGVEAEIRNKFGFIKEGEEVVIIAEPPVSFGDNVIEDSSKNTLDMFNFVFDMFR
jgi:cell division protein FtsB